MTASASSLQEALELLQATSPDLAACGPAVAHLLSRLANTCLRCITSTTHKRDNDASCAATHLSETLRQLADDKLNSYPYHAVPTCWRRLYTDAVLYGAIAQLANSDERGDARQLRLLQTIGRLDSAIVISGSPGPMRLELAQSLIALAQHQLAAAAPQLVEADCPRRDGNAGEEREWERPAKRPRTTTRRRSASPARTPATTTTTTTTTAAAAAAPATKRRPHPPPYIHIPLRELASLPTFLDPAHNPAHREPFIVRRGAVHFPAFDAPDSSLGSRPRDSPQEHGDDDGLEAQKAEDPGDDEKKERPRRSRSRWSDLTYLRQLAGPGRVVPVEVGGDYTQSGWGQKVMPFDEFLDSLGVGVGVGVESDADQQAGSHERWKGKETSSPLRGGGGGGAKSDGPTTQVSTTRGAADSKAHDFDADREGQSSSSLSTTATAAAERVTDRPIYYLAQHSLFRQFPALTSDLLIPDLVYSPPEHRYPSPSSTLNTSNEISSYEPPQSEEGYVLNAWLGPGGTKSAAHTDPWWNCYVQMAGSKWVWVAPPEGGPHMAAFGKRSDDDDSDGHDGGDGEGDGSAKPDSSGGAAEEYMTNTSSLDVTRPPPPLSPSNSNRTEPTSPPPPSPAYPPQFLQHVLPHARQAVLEEGDVLVMPPRWWHAMVGLETSFSVSMWF